MLSRRLSAVLALGLLAPLALACGTASAGHSAGHSEGRLAARPHATSAGCPAGLHRLGVDPERESLLYVPESAAKSSARLPLVVYLHGATGQASRGIDRLRPLADARGVLVLAPQALDYTWDGIHGSLGPDVARVDRALALAFDRCGVDPARVFVSGFSDGASYALTLGLANGELFSKVVAFSPCLISSDIAPSGRPAFFLSHGRADEILPIERCGRPLVKSLERAGYSVKYQEFDGRHEIPPLIAEDAFSWLLGPAPR